MSRARYWRRRLLVGLATLTVLALVVGAGAFGYVEYRFHQIHRENVVGLKPVSSPAKPYNVLLVGDDCRTCLNTSRFGTGQVVAGARSDVTMVLHVDPAHDRVSLLSIPRDLWLPVPGTTGENRINAALNHGPGSLVRAIEDDLNIQISHYVELNFNTFRDVVNALGGLNLSFPDRAYDAYSGLNVPAGCYHLDGTEALAVVRSRHFYYLSGGAWHYDGLGDLSRIQRSHAFLTVLASTVAKRGLANPVTDNSLISLVAKDLTIDSAFSLTDLAALGKVLAGVDLGAVPETTLSVDVDNSPDGYVFQGAQYGDVVFPSSVADHRAIAGLLGSGPSGSALRAGTVPVRVVNGSGIAGQAGAVATSLRGLGYPISRVATGQVFSTPSETVVYYGAGHEPAAQRLADDLGGAVALGFDPTVAGSGLALVTGSNLTVATASSRSAARSTTRSTGRSATTGASTPAGSSASSATAAGASPRSSQPGRAPSIPAAQPIGGLTSTHPAYPAFDPRACPAGAAARAVPQLAVPTGLPAT